MKRVELLVNGVNYQFQLASLDADYVYAQAKEFCLQHAASQSMSESALESGCTRVVLNNLIHKVNEKRAAEQQQAAANSNAQQEQRQGEAPQQAAAAAVARDPASTIFQVFLSRRFVPLSRTYQ